MQNYPNPFNCLTNIKIKINQANTVVLDVFNIKGQLVSRLINEYLKPGNYSKYFIAYDLPQGIYIAKLIIGSEEYYCKMSHIK